jgi:hypothetical protein
MFEIFKKKPAQAQTVDKPWLKRKEWRGPSIASQNKSTMWIAWGCAVFWTAIAFPLSIVEFQRYQQGESGLLFLLIFPLIGLGLFAWAITSTLTWRRFGKTPLTLDPYPGAIGGQVGGTLDINLPYDGKVAFNTTLTCLHVSFSGSSISSSSRSERVVWESEGYAYTQRSTKGTRLELLFDVDDKLPASDFKNRSSYHVWRLRVKAKMPGTDFNRIYEIPVFPTGEQAAHLHALSTDHQAAEEKRTQGIEKVLNISKIPGGVELYYPPFRHVLNKVIWMVFGGFLLGLSILMGQQGVSLTVQILLGGLGALAVFISVYTLLVSLWVRIDHAVVHTQRRLLGYAVVNKRVPRDQVAGLALKLINNSAVGSEHKTYYNLEIHTHSGDTVTIGFNIVGRDTAKEVLESLSLLTNIEAKA